MITSLPIRYRHAELAAVGLSPADAAEQVREAIYGEVVDTVNQGVRQYDLVVRLAPEERESIRQVRDLLLRGRGGATVRLSDVADIGPERSSNLITRENAQRKAVVSLNVAEGSNLGDLVAQVQERVDPIVQRDAGMTVSYGGQFEAQQSASRTILVAGVAVALDHAHAAPDLHRFDACGGARHAQHASCAHRRYRGDIHHQRHRRGRRVRSRTRWRLFGHRPVRSSPPGHLDRQSWWVSSRSSASPSATASC